MTEPRTFSHPQPALYGMRQIALLLLAALMPLAAVGLLIIAVILPAPLFGLMALLLLLLMTPLVMQLHVTPTVTLDANGLTVQPFIGADKRIQWDDVILLKPYPLLPSQHHEVIRRVLVGRKNYKEAEGLMLVVPGLDWRYRLAGWFTGVQARPVVAVTNRTHADYGALKQRLLHYLGDVADLETPPHASVARKSKTKHTHAEG